jgi:hypothetical protein
LTSFREKQHQYHRLSRVWGGLRFDRAGDIVPSLVH